MADTVESVGKSYAFGPFRLIPERQLLLRDGLAVRIGGRALDILITLVEQAGETVGKRELIARVWRNLFVEESNLKVNMNALRRALGEGSGTPHYIATVVGRGYRFVAPVQVAILTEGSLRLPAAAARNNLPTATTRIVGRQTVINSIRVDLAEARIVSIVGPGGIGKSTVALAVAEQALDAFRDGVWLVDLSALSDAGRIPNAIAMAIGLVAHSANMLAALGEHLRWRQVLIVLDSCEHVIEGVAAIADRLLADAGELRILATSREPLHIRGERVRRLPGLELPAEIDGISAERALDFPSVQLLVDRGVDRNEAFTLTDEDAPAAAAICRRLDGLALAIELAATHIDALGVSGLLAALDGRLQLLDTRRGGPERHRTLTATIEWSYDLLSDTEKTVMRRLALFAGSFTMAAACSIAVDSKIDRTSCLKALAGLVSKSLLSTEIRDIGMEYRMLDSTRAYALAKLGVGADYQVVALRHAKHSLDLLEAARADIERFDRAKWISLYAGKADDVRSALDWAFAAPDEHALAVNLTVAAIPFNKQLSLIEECRVAVERALGDAFAGFRSNRDELMLNLTLGATLLHTRGPLLRVKVVLSSALVIAEQLGDAGAELDCLRGLSEYELWTGDSRAAVSIAERIRSLEAKGQSAAAGDADAQAGSALSWLGALGAARQRLENIVYKPIVPAQRPDAARFDFDQRLTARGALATVLWLQGFAEQALETARRQLEVAESSNYAVSHCYALLHGATIIAMYVRDYEAAYAYLERGVAHARRHGLAIWEGMAIGPRARLDLYTGKPIDLRAFRETLKDVREGGFRMRYPNYLTNFGEALARQGDVGGGLAAIDEAITLSENTGQVVGIPEILRIKGNVIRFQDPDRWQNARECYLQSIHLARQDNALAWELRAAISLVKLCRDRGGDDGAEEMLKAAFARFTEGFSTGDLRRAQALIDARKST